MKSIKPQSLKMIAWCAALASLMQIYALYRYVDRLPDDFVGIGLYIITIYAFAVISACLFYHSKKKQ